MATEQVLYAQVFMIEEKKNENEAKFKFQGQFARSQP